MRKKNTGIIGCIAHCRDCEWKQEGYRNALALAARHCDFTKHTVDVEQTLHVEYYWKEKE